MSSQVLATRMALFPPAVPRCVQSVDTGRVPTKIRCRRSSVLRIEHSLHWYSSVTAVHTIVGGCSWAVEAEHRESGGDRNRGPVAFSVLTTPTAGRSSRTGVAGVSPTRLASDQRGRYRSHPASSVVPYLTCRSTTLWCRRGGTRPGCLDGTLGSGYNLVTRERSERWRCD
jgi:hypothetical protein